jgi:DNA-binding NarL/FixJ family response regulator
MPIRVYHCDDSPSFTHLVSFWLDEHPDIEHVGASHSGAEALAALPGLAPDVVLLDTMGQPGDTTLLEDIRAAVPGAAVVVYSGYVQLMGPGDLGAGADAYLPKGDDEGALVQVIRTVAAARG